MTIFYDTDKSVLWDDASVPVCEHTGHDENDIAAPVAVLAIALDFLAERDKWSYYCGACARTAATSYFTGKCPPEDASYDLPFVIGTALTNSTDPAGSIYQCGGWVVRHLPCPVAL